MIGSLRGGFPLLRRELEELACRKSTYLLRTSFAILLYGVALIFYQWNIVARAERSTASFLGSGRDLFEFLVFLNFVAIYLLLPALTAGVVTQEKERNALDLILISPLGRMELLLEKLLSRLIPMFGFLALFLPLLGLAYSLGGVTLDSLLRFVVVAGLAALQLGALSLAVSCYCRTTAQSFVSSYLAAILVFLGAPFLVWVIPMVGNSHFESALLSFVPPWLYLGQRGQPWGSFWLASIPLLGSTGLFLLLAWWFLPRRASPLPRVRRRWRAPAEPPKDSRLPDHEPVAWREIHRRGLGAPGKWLRTFLACEIPVVLLLALVVADAQGRRGDIHELTLLLFAVWAGAAVFVLVTGASLVAGERTQGTLSVLLTTPLSGVEILRQKVRAFRRTVPLFALPLLTVVMAEAVLERPRGFGFRDRVGTYSYAVASTVTVLTYLYFFSWYGFWVGLRSRSGTRAIIAAVVSMTLFVILSTVGVTFVFELLDLQLEDQGWVLFLTPLAFLTMLEVDRGSVLLDIFPSIWIGLLVNTAIWGGAALAIRHLCLGQAERYLGRPEGQTA